MRLAFGLALGMAVTSAQRVASGYFRNHLYVTLGLTTLATLAGLSAGFDWWPAMAAAGLSYVGSVCWLYESPRAGKIALWLIALLSLLGAGWNADRGIDDWILASELQLQLGIATSGLVLGGTLAAMLLGHWYLNAPGMELAPLHRLLLLCGSAVLLNAVVCAVGLAGNLWLADGRGMEVWPLFLFLRWVFGMAGMIVLLWMAWQTLRIPNTQSATGILYVAVIASFTGELMGLLLSAGLPFSL